MDAIYFYCTNADVLSADAVENNFFFFKFII